MFKAIKYQALTLCWATGILILCSMPGQSFSKPSKLLFEGFDKIAHLGLFFVLTILIFNGFIKQFNNHYFKITTCVLVGIIAVVYGGVTELLQWQFFTSRGGDWWDLFADTIGVAMAIFALFMLNNNYTILTTKPNYENV